MSSSATSHSSAMSGLPSQRGSHPEILLDKNCRIGSCQNSTCAKAENSEGLSVEVSFEIRDRPALSLCFARCHDLNGIQRLPRGPDILSAAGALVLLVIPFSDDGGVNQLYMDYFVYRAGPGEVPSLHLLPRPYPPCCRQSNVAVMPIGDDSEHYAVVFPDRNYARLVTDNHYADLHIYHSDRNAWCTQAASLSDDTETRKAKMTKLSLYRATSVVYAAGSGLVGWVDLWWGILLCNVLDENPTVRFIALPVPEPCQTHTKFEFEYLNPETHRHVTMHDGVMKFIELKYHQDAAFNVKRRDDQGWMATTWTRQVSSDAWHEGLTLDTSDISVIDDDSSFLHLLPEILGEDAWEKCSSGAPILSLHDDNIVYILVVKRNLVDTVTIVLTLNTGSFTLESCAQCFGLMIEYFEPSYVPSVLSSYFEEKTSVLS